ncbi:AAA family ATPase [Herbiconiux solani]|uniref:AAA family ATPase n=1 Tax=Herbiconiux solani TaxID=661329 RepID=UPI000A038858|nr:AAA family ATPase [Herbiconiux solani]
MTADTVTTDETDAAELRRIINATNSRNTDRRELLITPASHIRTRRQKWLWNDRIPLGTVTVFAGRGGEGKSTFALHIGAQAILGALEGDLYGVASPFIIISHEDDWSTVMKPRLIAARADTDAVFKLSIRATVDEETHETVPSLPIDVELIRQALEETGAKVILIDPISSTLAGDLHKVADVRRALDPLASLAQEMEVAVIAIMHFNKGAGSVSDKLSGSHAFRDVSRSVLLFATDDETGQRVVSVDKSNYSAERGSSFAFNLRSVEVETDDGAFTTVAQVDYLGDTDVNVSDIVNRDQTGGGDHDDRNAAQGFILDYLHDQESFEAPARDVLKAGRANGFSDQEIKDARRRCKNPKVASGKSGYGAGWVWSVEGGTEGGVGGKNSNPATLATFLPPSGLVAIAGSWEGAAK